MERRGVESVEEPVGGRGDVRGDLAAIAIVAALVLASYANGLRAPFTFDDIPNLVETPSVHMVHLDAASLARAASGFPTNRWFARLSFALNYYAGGLEPRGYHAVNVLVHLGTAVLVYLLAVEILARLRGDRESARWPAAMTAALFAVHPVQTQAVTYIVQRMTSMGAFFAFGALLLYVRARGATGRRKIGAAGAAVVLGYLAFACKETYVVLPVMALVLEGLLFPGVLARMREHAARAASIAGGLALLGAALVWSYWPVLEASHARFGITPSERLLSQGRILAHYVSLLALPLPSRLQLDYGWLPSRGMLDPPATLPGLLAVAVIVIGAALARRRAPLFWFATFWFCGALLVEQTILPIDLVFEHRLYFASFGPFVLAASAIERASKGMAASRWVVAAPVVAALSWGTHVRNDAWNDPIRLYADRGRSPSEARALLTLAAQLRRAGRLSEARAILEKVLAIEPKNVGTYIELGVVAWTGGDWAGAERWYRRSIEVRPTAEGWYDLGWLLTETGRDAEAEGAFQNALGIDPSYARAQLSLAIIVARRGDLAGARARLDEAIRIDPGYVVARQNRARISIQEGRFREAIEDATEAARLSPESADAHVLLGDVLRAAGRRREAATAYERARAIDGGSGQATEGGRAAPSP